MREITNLRGFDGIPSVKVMADGGQGFLKFCLTILPENYDPIADKGLSQEELEEEEVSEPASKRSTYIEGGSAAKKGKLTGVNRLIMLAIVPQVKETYDNLKVIFNLTQLNHIPFKFVGDHKLTLIALGKQTATSMFPSPYCHVSLRVLQGTEDPEEEKELAEVLERGVLLNSGCGPPLTFGDLKMNFEKFISLGKNKKKAMECESTINPPLFNEPDDMPVSQKVIFPELHNLSGCVNDTFFKGVVPKVGREKALLWPRKLGKISSGYHGEVFEGNACRALLKNFDRLNDPEILEGQENPFILQPYVSFLQAMNNVVTDCFSTGKVDRETLDKHLQDLRIQFSGTDLSETLKLHCILEHIPECLETLDGRGFGLWSEQAGESIHRVFLHFWNKHKIHLLTHPKYGISLKKAVVEFSSRHI